MDEIAYLAEDIELRLFPYGATVKSLRVRANGEWRNVVLGFDRVEDYLSDQSYQGCIVGRLVNRVRHSQFSRGGEIYVLPANDGDGNLHGGADGLSKQLWSAAPRGTDRQPVVMTYASPAGQAGFPGNLHVEVRFVLRESATLQIDYLATVDAPCPVDLTHHLYFNLGSAADRDLRNHRLQLGARHIQELDNCHYATGHLLEVRGTPFDVRYEIGVGGFIDRASVKEYGFVNGNWCGEAGLNSRAILTSPDKALTLQLLSDQPCLQVYTGADVAAFPGGGIALEPQGYIDAVNFDHLPSPWLQPGEDYRRTAIYRFTAND